MKNGLVLKKMLIMIIFLVTNRGLARVLAFLFSLVLSLAQKRRKERKKEEEKESNLFPAREIRKKEHDEKRIFSSSF